MHARNLNGKHIGRNGKGLSWLQLFCAFQYRWKGSQSSTHTGTWLNNTGKAHITLGLVILKPILKKGQEPCDELLSAKLDVSLSPLNAPKLIGLKAHSLSKCKYEWGEGFSYPLLAPNFLLKPNPIQPTSILQWDRSHKILHKVREQFSPYLRLHQHWKSWVRLASSSYRLVPLQNYE